MFFERVKLKDSAAEADLLRGSVDVCDAVESEKLSLAGNETMDPLSCNEPVGVLLF